MNGPKIILTFFSVGMGLALFLSLGGGQMLMLLQDSQDGGIESATLRDYDAIDGVAVEDGTVTITFNNVDVHPRLDRGECCVGGSDIKITHVSLARADGTFAKTKNYTVGAGGLQFDVSETVLSGTYRLTLTHRYPPDIFGEVEDEHDIIEFTVDDDGTITVTQVPTVAKYNE